MSGSVAVSHSHPEAEHLFKLPDEAEVHRVEEQYWSYLRSGPEVACFAFIFTPTRVILVGSQDATVLDKFVNAVRLDMQRLVPVEVWEEKEAAVQALWPLLHEQLVTQSTQYATLVRSLSPNSYAEDKLPITSTKKEKSGVLGMESRHSPVFRDFYFVLFENELYYYKDSKSTTPTGFVTLNRAAIHLDSMRLARGECVFKVNTPLETFVCRTKHSVALSEWVSVLEARLLSAPDGRRKQLAKPGLRRKNSLELLENINTVLFDVSTLESLVLNSTGFEHFVSYLKSGNQRHLLKYLQFSLQVEQLRSLVGQDAIKISSLADTIFDTYLENDGESLLDEVSEELRAGIAQAMSPPSTGVFDEAQAIAHSVLQPLFERFKNSSDFVELEAVLAQTAEMNHRPVEPFPPKHSLYLLLKMKGVSRSQKISFKRKGSVLTIGRDKSNDIVIEDSRVSRSHARLEYSKSHCEFIDVGSSCGSKLNGRPVLRASLRSGDIIELGQSTLIFGVRKQTRLESMFGFAQA